MSPELILSTIKSGFDALRALLEWLMTPQGQAWSKQLAADRTAWDNFWKDATIGVERLFRGELFKEAKKP